jgi:hypothetical protein
VFHFGGGGGNGFLFTLLVKDRATGQGQPVAYLLASHERQCLPSLTGVMCRARLKACSEPVAAWLAWLRENLDWIAKYMMIDCSTMEALAIKLALPGAAILYCIWHLLRAIRTQLDAKVRQPLRCRLVLPGLTRSIDLSSA